MLKLVDDTVMGDADDEPVMDTRVFKGTRWECEAFLDSFFSVQRKLVEGARSSAPDHMVPMYDALLNDLGRVVYEVTVRSVGVAIGDEIRPENAYRAMRMQTALDTFDALARGETGEESHDVI